MLLNSQLTVFFLSAEELEDDDEDSENAAPYNKLLMPGCLIS